jgi:hypothetical protein
MNTYKITNITNLAAKRDRQFNTTIAIEYIDKMTKKTMSVKPGATVYLNTSSLPLSVHRLRIKNLIVVSEVDASEFQKIVEKPKKKEPVKLKAVKKPVVVEEEDESAKETKTTKKKTTSTTK